MTFREFVWLIVGATIAVALYIVPITLIELYG